MSFLNPYIIGITGGIGSGKSVVSHLMHLMGIPVYNCDNEAKRLMNENDSIHNALVETIGNEIYDATGKLNKKELAAYMFDSPERVKLINNIVHPAVRADFKQWAQHIGKAVIAVESAILSEAGMDADVNTVVLVYAPETLRLQRTILRDTTDEQSVRSRMRHQQNEQEYMQHADIFICNDGTSSLISQIQNLLQRIYGQQI